MRQAFERGARTYFAFLSLAFTGAAGPALAQPMPGHDGVSFQGPAAFMADGSRVALGPPVRAALRVLAPPGHGASRVIQTPMFAKARRPIRRA